MALTIEQLSSLGQYLNICLGSLLLAAGLFGACMNLWLFSQHYFKNSTCARFILTSSVFDLLHLIVALFLRILADGFHIDPASSSVIGCRIRYYLITFSAYASVGCRCLAAFNRYACTSRSRAFRRWSSFQMVYRFLIGNTLLWACFALPNMFYFNLIPISPTRVICHISKQMYAEYFAYFVNPVLYFALPLIILIHLTIQTHRNLRLMNTTRRLQRLERQITAMIILQTLTNSISSIPYGAQVLYAAITFHVQKDQYRLAQEHLFVQITRLSYYVNFVSAFYIYYIASEQIRSIVSCSFPTARPSQMKENFLLYDPMRSQLSENNHSKTNIECRTSFSTWR